MKTPKEKTEAEASLALTDLLSACDHEAEAMRALRIAVIDSAQYRACFVAWSKAAANTTRCFTRWSEAEAEKRAH